MIRVTPRPPGYEGHKVVGFSRLWPLVRKVVACLVTHWHTLSNVSPKKPRGIRPIFAFIAPHDLRVMSD